MRRGRAGYYGLITYLDDKIGRLLDGLKETDQYENTVVVYCSDHGEMNGEHGMWRKSSFYEASVRVPLQIAWPGHLPAGRRIREVVSLVDLVATLAEIADVLRLGSVSNVASLDGNSLLPLINHTAKLITLPKRGKMRPSPNTSPTVWQDPRRCFAGTAINSIIVSATYHNSTTSPKTQTNSTTSLKTLPTHRLFQSYRTDSYRVGMQSRLRRRSRQSQKERRLIEQAYRARASL